jgi:hypothetical protein
VVGLQTFALAARGLRDHLYLPEIDAEALTGLKFSDALELRRPGGPLADKHAAAVLAEPGRLER